MGYVIVSLAVAAALALAVHSLWKSSHKGGGGACTGDCSSCGKCR